MQLVPFYWGETESVEAEWLWRRAAVWGETSLFATKPVLPRRAALPLFLPEAAWHCQQQGQQKSHKCRCGLASVTFDNWQKATSPDNGCAQFGAGAFCSLREESLGNVLLQSPSPYWKQRRYIQ